MNLAILDLRFILHFALPIMEVFGYFLLGDKK